MASIDPDAARAFPTIPRNEEGPVFREPWEAPIRSQVACH